MISEESQGGGGREHYLCYIETLFISPAVNVGDIRANVKAEVDANTAWAIGCLTPYACHPQA
jgi:hypothetical protein